MAAVSVIRLWQRGAEQVELLVKYLLLMMIVFGKAALARGEPSVDACLMQYFLQLGQKTSVGNDSERCGSDALTAYKYRERLYGVLLHNIARERANDDDLKRILFFGFAADSRNDAGLMETFAADLMAVYTRNRGAVLSILKRIPKLQPSFCHYMGRYFGLEDRHGGGLESFLGRNRDLLRGTLGKEAAVGCVRIMQTVAR